MSTLMNSIDVNYILDNQLQLFDYIFIKKVGIDCQKNYVYLVQDKFRDNRFAKFIIVTEGRNIQDIFSNLIIHQNCNDSKMIQPIYDFTVSKERDKILVTMPVPPRTLYSVIKDYTVDLRSRLSLCKNIVDGCMYMHCRRRAIFAQIRPQSIVIHQDINAFGKTKRAGISDVKELYARLNSFSMLTETKYKPQGWKWTNTQAHYYDAPQVWTEIDRGKKKIQINYTYQNSKTNESKKHSSIFQLDQKTDIWSLGLVLIQILSAKRINQILSEREVPAKLLKQITNRQKMLRHRNKQRFNQVLNGDQEQNQMTVQKFYERILRYIESFPIRSIIQKMLAYKPDKRPKTQEIFHVFQRLQVLDKRTKNIGRMSAFKRSLRNLRQNYQQKQRVSNSLKSQQNDNFDDKKSVVSMKSVKSGRSSKSYISETRKRIVPDFSTVMYARQQITESSSQMNSLHRTYFEDCKNRLLAEQNFTPPAKKIVMKKDDKAVILSMKGQNDQDIKKWDIQKAVGNKSQLSFQQRLLQNLLRQNKNAINENEDKNKQKRKGEILLNNLRLENEQNKNMQQQKKQKDKFKELVFPFGPSKKKIPHNSVNIKEYGYNDNLINYHYLGILELNSFKSYSCCLFRPESVNNTEGPQKSVQFLLNLKFRNLNSIPSSFLHCLQPPNCLKYLNISHNIITSLASLTFSTYVCQNLIVLDASYNNLTQIDGQLWKIQKLEELYLTNNQIKSMDGLDEQVNLPMQPLIAQNEPQTDNLSKQNEIILQDQEKKVQQQYKLVEQHKQGENVQNISLLQEQRRQNNLMNEQKPQIQMIEQKMNINNQKDPNRMNIENQGYQSISSNKSEKKAQFIPYKWGKRCKNLKRFYIDSNKITKIEKIFSLPSLQIISLRDNPITDNKSTIRAFEILQNKNIKAYF